MKRKIIAFEILLCFILIISCIYLHTKTKERTVSVGTFDAQDAYNDTLKDFSNNLFGDLFYA